MVFWGRILWLTAFGCNTCKMSQEIVEKMSILIEFDLNLWLLKWFVWLRATPKGKNSQHSVDMPENNNINKSPLFFHPSDEKSGKRREAESEREGGNLKFRAENSTVTRHSCLTYCFWFHVCFVVVFACACTAHYIGLWIFLALRCLVVATTNLYYSEVRKSHDYPWLDISGYLPQSSE